MTFHIKVVREVTPMRRPLPQVLETVGRPPTDGLQVFLSKQAEEKILLAAPPEKPAETMPDLARAFLGENECGGLLIGNVYVAELSGCTVTFTAIVDAVPAQEAAAGPTFVEMGVADLLAVADHLRRLREQRQGQVEADLRIVGWYHTHPGFGVFMSGTDQATQRDVFGMPWQVAVVYDPLNGEYGVFYGRDSKHLAGWYLFDAQAEGFPPPLPPANATEPRPSGDVSLRRRLMAEFDAVRHGLSAALAHYRDADIS
ncbi:MAG: Mov34/MPN/PAD-1 family protein [Chloracidobacterium sp.]|nr:Mov34/MPN/PAD-1 family protein [Chloracidobacterium sp.]MDW8217880.1 Mov34/MPN/PAD-1 family protein [Acidobacteriota bacterium]